MEKLDIGDVGFPESYKPTEKPKKEETEPELKLKGRRVSKIPVGISKTRSEIIPKKEKELTQTPTAKALITQRDVSKKGKEKVKSHRAAESVLLPKETSPGLAALVSPRRERIKPKVTAGLSPPIQNALEEAVHSADREKVNSFLKVAIEKNLFPEDIFKALNSLDLPGKSIGLGNDEISNTIRKNEATLNEMRAKLPQEEIQRLSTRIEQQKTELAQLRLLELASLIVEKMGPFASHKDRHEMRLFLNAMKRSPNESVKNLAEKVRGDFETQVKNASNFLKEIKKLPKDIHKNLGVDRRTFQAFLLKNAKTMQEVEQLLHYLELGTPALSKTPTKPLTNSNIFDLKGLAATGEMNTDETLKKLKKIPSNMTKAVSDSTDALDCAFRHSFLSIQPSELCQANWTRAASAKSLGKEALAPNVVSFTKLYNYTHYLYKSLILEAGILKLSELAKNKPPTESQREKAQKACAPMIKYCIKTAYALYERGNFAAAHALLSAVESKEVSRLKPAMEELSKDVKLNSERESLLAFFESHGGSANQLKGYEDKISKNLPCVPDLTVYQGQLFKNYDAAQGENDLEAMNTHGKIQEKLSSMQKSVSDAEIPKMRNSVPALAVQLFTQSSEELDERYDKLTDQLRPYPSFT